MKIRTRIIIAFLIITVVPISLIYMMILALSDYQGKMFSETYGLEEQVNLSSGTSIRIFSYLTENLQIQLDRMLDEDVDQILRPDVQEKINSGLQQSHSFLVVLKDQELIFAGNAGITQELEKDFENFDDLGFTAEWGNYLDSETEHLIKLRTIRFSDGSEGNIILVTNVVEVVPEVKFMFMEMLVSGIVILILTAAIMVAWVYRSIWKPLGQLQEATKQIRDGNLDFTLEVEDDDEIGQLCQNFEEMRIRLKETTEEKIQYDKESKELISNISHDLKTPITAIKGYVEGIMDGVASSPEKLERYIRTIYNKANDMDRLIDELTFYSKIDTNKIPYVFAKINVADYFGDCIDEVGLDLDARGVDLRYYNYVDEDVLVIADAEQLKRVINNIIGNSLKYMDKKQGIINIRILDVGDFVQIEIEDNGKGIGQKELPYIFDRFYRTDSSRNSSKGGSGIGLSIVRKIIEDHGGKIWATSKLGVGTEIHFVLRKINA